MPDESKFSNNMLADSELLNATRDLQQALARLAKLWGQQENKGKNSMLNNRLTDVLGVFSGTSQPGRMVFSPSPQKNNRFSNSYNGVLADLIAKIQCGGGRNL